MIAATTLQRTERERSSALPPASASCALHWLLTAGPAAAALVPPPPAAPTVTTACKPHNELGVGPTSPGPYVKGGRCGRRCASGCRCVCSCCCRSTIAVISGFTLFLAIMSVAAYDPLAVQWHGRHSTIRGTNVGGWLLAERWLVGAYETATDTTCCSGVPNPYNHSTVDCRTMKPPIDPQAGAKLTCQVKSSQVKHSIRSRLDLPRLDVARLDSTRLDSTRLDSTRFDSDSTPTPT